MVEAQSVNMKKTTTKKNDLFFAFSVFVANPKNYFKRWPIPLVVGDVLDSETGFWEFNYAGEAREARDY